MQEDINDNSLTPEVRLSPDAHWLYVVAFKQSDIAMTNTLITKDAFYLHSIDDLTPEVFVLGTKNAPVTNQQLGIDSEVVRQLKLHGEAERRWPGREIWFAYKLVPLKHADMMRKKT